MKKTALIFLVFIIILSFSLRAYSLMEPINTVDPVDVMIEIKKGMTGKEIAKLLEKEGLIRSSTVFYLLLRFKDIDDLKSGYYSFSTSQTPLEIIKKLQEGKEESFKITIPEGFTLGEILERFNSLSVVKYDKKLLAEELEKNIKNIDIKRGIDFQRLKKPQISAAEGFIVPTTYHFPLSYTEEDIAEHLISYFREKRLPLLKKGAAKNNYSAYEILIIASLIEEEAKIEEENKVVASVIYNRLKNSMPLQLDATVQYALEERKQRVLYKDLEIDSPYNTYQINKLPPTPIASPGEVAVRAAVEPADTDYLFYFARQDGSHVFTKSYDQHLKKQRQLNSN